MLDLVLVSLLVLMCAALISSICLYCTKKPMVSIRETHTSEDTYIPSTEFLIHRPRPMQFSIDQNYLLSPHFSVDAQILRSSVAPTETESNNSYENASDPCVGVNNRWDNEDEVPDPGYIEVLPDPETAPPADNNNRAPSPYDDDDDDEGNYENEEHNYVNVGGLESSVSQSQASARSCDQSQDTNDDSSSDSDDDDDDEGDYVNQPSVGLSRSEAGPSA